MFTLFSAKCTGVPSNCLYPERTEVVDAETLRKAVSHDYVCAEYKDSYRSINNFMGSDCLAFDCDNDHSEEEGKWVDADDVKAAFPDVAFAVHYSRSNMREKGGKKARPKFHVLFPIREVRSKEEYVELKRKVSGLFPYFDKNAMDAARFFFGTSEAKAEIVDGRENLTDFIEEYEFDAHFDKGPIREGSRNSTMSRFAGRVLKRYGDTDEAREAYLEESKKCVPPLESGELKIIWNSARGFYKNTVLKDKSYVAPERYNDPNSYKPADYSDVGQAEVLRDYFQNELRYSPATLYVRYQGTYWKESDPGSQAIAQELTRRQLKEADDLLAKAKKELDESGALSAISSVPKNKVESVLSDGQLKIYDRYQGLIAYRKYAIDRRSSKNITATLKEARPLLEIDVGAFDSNEFLLNTPNGTYDLRKGMDGLKPHDPEDFITKVTGVSPSDKGKGLWLDSLGLIFHRDQELIDYVQSICGLAAIGKVYVEALIIAFGDGGNGKSTFWNSVSRALGIYSGNLSADTLTVGCKRNVKPEMAEMNGKRLLIAAESQEGARLNDSIVKQLCSTDDVFAEKKYKSPFSFKPCHTLVLYTNHLPRVSATDDGVWRRLIVIPFSSKLTGKGDIKNYGDYLYENAGEYILSWIIEGAKKVIDMGFRIAAPRCVQQAIDDYKEQNDWFHHFTEDCCEAGPDFREGSNDLYTAYRNYCIQTNEFVRSTADFYGELEKMGCTRFVEKRKRYFKGIRLNAENGDFTGILD